MFNNSLSFIEIILDIKLNIHQISKCLLIIFCVKKIIYS